MRKGIQNSNYRHGLDGHPVSRAWYNMMQRCFQFNSKDYPNYGGRGITVCSEWQNFDRFSADVFPTWKKGLQLDRFPDNNGNYCKDNFRWATPAQNGCNRRPPNCRIKVKVDGVTKSLREWSEFSGIPMGCLRYRYRQGVAGSNFLAPSLPGKHFTRRFKTAE